MKNIFLFFGIVTIITLIIWLTNHSYITPVGAEIMIIGTMAFGSWYTLTKIEKEEDA